VWDFIRDQQLNYHLGNAIKYVCRAGHKDDPIKDLEKAIHYLINEKEHLLKERTRVPKSFQSGRITGSWVSQLANRVDQ